MEKADDYRHANSNCVLSLSRKFRLVLRRSSVSYVQQCINKSVSFSIFCDENCSSKLASNNGKLQLDACRAQFSSLHIQTRFLYRSDSKCNKFGEKNFLISCYSFSVFLFVGNEKSEYAKYIGREAQLMEFKRGVTDPPYGQAICNQIALRQSEKRGTKRNR